ncbi:MAG: gcdB1 [Herbinix sp.]|jgi:Na+-transporting methylmalonyl-CoA/oxaloacetate decarboxylase beta subunit|nr:gcdB1 [Herbinix sp.]
MKYNTDFSDASSIGIIGGADGPTTIYVANSKAPGFTALFALLSIVGIIYIIRTKRKNKNNNLGK